MKIKQLLERQERIPFTYDHDLEVYDEEQGDYIIVPIELRGTIYITPDPYNVGDSPTETEVDIARVINRQTGQPVPWSVIADSADWLREKIIKAYVS